MLTTLLASLMMVVPQDRNYVILEEEGKAIHWAHSLGNGRVVAVMGPVAHLGTGLWKIRTPRALISIGNGKVMRLTCDFAWIVSLPDGGVELVTQLRGAEETLRVRTQHDDRHFAHELRARGH